MASKLDFKGKSPSSAMVKDVVKKSGEDVGGRTVRNIPVSEIDNFFDNENIFNKGNLEPLMESIERNGFMGVVEVYKENDRYVLLSGHRRVECMKERKEKYVPCYIVEKPESESGIYDRLIMSNMASRDLTPIEVARALTFYEEKVLNAEKYKGDKRKELGKRFGMTSSQVYKYKSLVGLIKPLQDLIESDKISYASIYKCANLEKEKQEDIYKILKNELQKDEIESLTGKDVDTLTASFFEEVKEEKKEEKKSVKPVSENKEKSIVSLCNKLNKLLCEYDSEKSDEMLSNLSQLKETIEKLV